MDFKTFFSDLLGLTPSCLSLSQMLLRAIIVYTLGVLLVRMGKRRFLGSPTPLDVVLILMFGSVMSRAISGTAPFLPTLATGSMLILMHWIFSSLAFYSSSLGYLFKGTPLVLVKDGQIIWENMRKHHISEKDLMSALRRHAKLIDLASVHLAILERNGEISVIPQAQKYQMIELPVQDGVQKIILELHNKPENIKLDIK